MPANTNYANLASRVFNTPLAVEPAYAKTFFSALSSRLGIVEIKAPDGEVILGEKMRSKAASYGPNRTRERPYQVVDGVAIIPVSGTLVHKFGYLRPTSGMTGYDGLIARIVDAIGDPEVRGILLDMDSPGGEVAGCFDTTAMIAAYAKQKPIWSLTYDMACSACFAIASATSRRLITQSGVAGSVGVIMAHVSRQEELAAMGRKVTLIYSGKYKAEGNPYEDLPEETLSRFQAEMHTLREQFAGIVATNTGLSIEAVMSTEAQVYRGQGAIDVGFAHEIVNGHEAVGIFSEYLKTNSKKGVVYMTTEQTQPVADVAKERTQAATEERGRIKSILQSEAAAERRELAEYFAFETSMPADQASAALDKAPKTAASGSVPQGLLDAAMGNTEQPKVGADTSNPTGDKQDEAATILSDFRAATGKARRSA
ncbi:S49 family peptidase [Hahella sp. KA22]|uniref:S49 family peptidase n=1 Tax=Hahella sp. KA22 TaxID=1628392 RepID=UPI000FDDB124|nr:S49 family peptidase [Hahella sp. KA22]AZZ92753.1 S49 family peptidase [Hahella sp. KA22]QAY56127.1 S49 family peptidase [Hahella sp. KA22]